MRIVSLKEFLLLPIGTVYCKFDTESCFGHLEIKKDSVHERDFFTTGKLVDCIECHNSDEWSDLVDEMEHTGKSVSLNFNRTTRDGCFKDDQLFAILEKHDVSRLQEILNKYHPYEGEDDDDLPNAITIIDDQTFKEKHNGVLILTKNHKVFQYMVPNAH